MDNFGPSHPAESFAASLWPGHLHVLRPFCHRQAENVKSGKLCGRSKSRTTARTQSKLKRTLFELEYVRVVLFIMIVFDVFGHWQTSDLNNCRFGQ